MRKHRVNAIETGLMPMSSVAGKDMGQALIELAQEKNREAVQSAVVSKVQDLQVRLKKQQDYLANCQTNIDFLKRKLQAVAAGQFHVSTYGDWMFLDRSLNKDIVVMKECINCGASADTRYRG